MSELIKKSEFSFPKSSRLLSSKQYRVMTSSSKTFTGEASLVSIWKHPSIKTTKLGLTVTKKYGKANKRNYFKRLSREAFRLVLPKVSELMWIHVRPHKNSQAVISLPTLQNDILSAVHTVSTEMLVAKQGLRDPIEPPSLPVS